KHVFDRAPRPQAAVRAAVRLDAGRDHAGRRGVAVPARAQRIPRRAAEARRGAGRPGLHRPGGRAAPPDLRAVVVADRAVDHDARDRRRTSRAHAAAVVRGEARAGADRPRQVLRRNFLFVAVADPDRAAAADVGACDFARLGPVRRGAAGLRAVRGGVRCDRHRLFGLRLAPRRRGDGGFAGRTGPDDAGCRRADQRSAGGLARLSRAAHPPHAFHARPGAQHGRDLLPADHRVVAGPRGAAPRCRKGARLMRRFNERADAWLYAALLLVGAACIALLSARFDFTADWSKGARASISPQAQAILKQLPGELDVVSYARPGGALRGQIRTFVERWQRFKPDLIVSFVDPDADPAAMREAGVSVDGEIVLKWRGREQHVVQLDERDFGDALARLTRGRDRLVAFVSGDGERAPDGKANADVGDFAAQLAQRGIRALSLNLAQSAVVPRNTDLVVLASPQAELPSQSVKALTDWIARGGNFLWLTEPGNDDLGLSPLGQVLGVRVLPGLLVDGAGTRLGIGDPRMLVANDYPVQAITRGFQVNTLFPQAAALAAASGAPWSIHPILSSSAQSWNQIAPIDPTQPSTIKYDAGVGELRGPLDFGFAL